MVHLTVYAHSGRKWVVKTETHESYAKFEGHPSDREAWARQLKVLGCTHISYVYYVCAEAHKMGPMSIEKFIDWW